MGISTSLAAPPAPTRTALVRAVELNVGERQQVELCNGAKASVRLLSLHETRDDLRNAVREARVKLMVNGEPVSLVSAMYRRPVTVGGVQIDCPITKGYLENTTAERWGLAKDVRLRLWPAGSPLVAPGTFLYPAKQRWFASNTQMANDPTFVDGGERPGSRRIYYHSGLDIGGAEGLVPIVAATDGLVVSRGTDVLAGYDGTPVAPRYDVVYLLDARGWYYRYSHLQTIDASVRLGERVRMGGPIGVLGKEGASGGWSHLHFEIKSRQPSGKWGTQEGYAFIWEAYVRQHTPKLIAVARPHQVAWTGQIVQLDATRSWSASGTIARFDWIFSDGSRGTGARPTRGYRRPGTYSETLRVTDADGNVAYDFAVVQIFSQAEPEPLPPSIHATYAPTTGIRPGDEVTFKVRTFRTTHGQEVWDFGDGTPAVTVKSDGNVEPRAKDGYAVTTHRFAKPGDYLVRVERSNEHDHKAVGRLHVRVRSD